MVDLTGLNASVSALGDEVGNTEGADNSVETLLAGVGAETARQVAAALAAEGTATQTQIDAATNAVAAVTARFIAARTQLSAALAASGGVGTGAPATT